MSITLRGSQDCGPMPEPGSDEDPIAFIDCDLFRKQRILIDRLIMRSHNTVEQKTLIGLQNFLDCVADRAADHYGLKGCLLTESEYNGR